jgi:uncharacterized protein YebE (UPF0316 family)
VPDIGLTAAFVFVARVVDVSLGTLRTIAVVQGRTLPAIALGFFETIVWLLAAGHVLARVDQHPLLALAFAGGYAAGNGAGIVIERWFALGHRLLVITTQRADAVSEALGRLGLGATRLAVDDRQSMLHVVCPRRQMDKLLTAARQADPQLEVFVQPVEQAPGRRLRSPLPSAFSARNV